MPRQIFVNLPVADLARATAFYEAIGGRKEPRFSGDREACMVFSDTIHVMLLTRTRFADFAPRPIADARAATEVLLCLTEESREAVDAVVTAGAAAGGTADIAPRQDHGFMVLRTIEDPDGHIWEVVWMDMAGFDAMKAAGAPPPA